MAWRSASRCHRRGARQCWIQWHFR
uniref:Uncharacterized protein n=1 Tax=Arundo donax TaxID=35708 RepID=A0A0A9CDZ4_ARUDO